MAPKCTKERIPRLIHTRCFGTTKNCRTHRYVHSWSRKASPTFMSAVLPMMFASVSICVVARSNMHSNHNIETVALIRIFLLYCWLGATATDSLSAGYRTVLIDDCCRGVDMQDIEATKEGILGNHGIIVQSKEVSWKCATAIGCVHPNHKLGEKHLLRSHLILIDGTWFRFNCLRFFLSAVSRRWKRWSRDVTDDQRWASSLPWSWKMLTARASEADVRFKGSEALADSRTMQPLFGQRSKHYCKIHDFMLPFLLLMAQFFLLFVFQTNLCTF